MGFGHRVYKNYDPRATVMRNSCHDVLAALGMGNDPLLELAMEMEAFALKDEYFISRSSTRTSISIRASSSARWASR